MKDVFKTTEKIGDLSPENPPEDFSVTEEQEEKYMYLFGTFSWLPDLDSEAKDEFSKK